MDVVERHTQLRPLYSLGSQECGKGKRSTDELGCCRVHWAIVGPLTNSANGLPAPVLHEDCAFCRLPWTFAAATRTLLQPLHPEATFSQPQPSVIIIKLAKKPSVNMPTSLSSLAVHLYRPQCILDAAGRGAAVTRPGTALR